MNIDKKARNCTKVTKLHKIHKKKKFYLVTLYFIGNWENVQSLTVFVIYELSLIYQVLI